MHLKIPIYSNQLYYYYDVLEALARDVFMGTIKEEREELLDILTMQEIWNTEDILMEDREVTAKEMKSQVCKYCYNED